MLRPTEHLSYVSSQDGCSVLDVERGIISILNATGSYVWERLAAGHTPEMIVDNLAEETSLPRTELDEDVRQFIEKLRSEGLLEK